MDGTCIAYMWKRRGMQINSHQKCKEEITLVKQKDKWKDYAQINLRQLAFEGIFRQDNVAQDSVQQQTLMKTVINIVAQN